MTVGHAVWPDQLDATERALLRPGVPAHLERGPDVLVVGGGIVGCATAATCVQAGLGSVVLIEGASLGAGASGGAAGLLQPEAHVGVDPPEFVAFMRQSLEAWRELDATWPGGVGFLATDWKGHAQGRVNPLRAIARLAAGLPCVATGIEVTAFSDGVVRTSIGDFHPRTVIFATGNPPPLEHLDVPAFEVKGHMLCSAPSALSRPAALTDLVTVIEDGRLLMGGTLDLGDDERIVRPDIAARMWQELVTAWPDAATTVPRYTWACFRPAHPDHLPVIDRIPGEDNAWFTSGHYKTGILCAPATARALADWIETGNRPSRVEPFGVARLVRPTASYRASPAQG